MTAQDFAYWLRGYAEITNNKLPNEVEWKIICDHLNLVFQKVTPDYYPTESLPIPISPIGIIHNNKIPDDKIYC